MWPVVGPAFLRPECRRNSQAEEVLKFGSEASSLDRMKISSGRYAWVLASMAGLLAVGHAQDVSGDKPIELSPYTVTDVRELPPPETWQYASVPGFEVLSAASAAKTAHLTRSFQRFCAALEFVWPDVQRRTPEPISFIVCNSARQFALFKPESADAAPVTQITRVLTKNGRVAIIVDVGTLHTDDPNREPAVVELSDVGSSESGSRLIGDAYRQLYREYVHHLMASAEPRAPAWFEEGLAQIFMSMEIMDKSVVVGKLDDSGDSRSADGSRMAAQDLDFNALLTRGKLMPMEEMLSMPHDAPEMRSAMASLWGKQCYAFVHWGLYGNNRKNQKAFVTFIARLAKRPLSEELFKETFKMSYRDMLLTLRGYAQATDHAIAGVDAERGTKLPFPPPVTVRPATEAEIGRIKGEAILLAGNLPAARGAMMTSFLRGERDPELLASIGLLEKSAGDETKAERFIAAAAQGKTSRPQVYLEIARRRFAEAEASPAGGPGRFSPQQITAILTPLFTARGQQPRLAEVYRLIADTWAKSAVVPEPDHLTVLNEGVLAFPRNAPLVYAVAVQKARAGLTADVAKLVEHGMKISAQDPEMKARFVALQKD